MRLISFITALIIFNANNIYSRNDTLQYLYFDYNILQRIIDEHTFSVEYKAFRYHSVIFSVGKVFSHGENDDKYIGLSPNQDTWPFRAYNGMDYKLGYRFNYCILNAIDLYIGPQFVLKDLYYRNEHFINDHGPEEGSDHFVRSEDAIVKGINMVTGFRVNIELLYGIIIYNNFFAGLEYRNRQRNYTTYSSDNSLVPAEIEYHPVPLGNFTVNQKYMVPIIGIKLGIGKRFNVRH